MMCGSMPALRIRPRVLREVPHAGLWYMITSMGGPSQAAPERADVAPSLSPISRSRDWSDTIELIQAVRASVVDTPPREDPSASWAG
jgi:hypothetical protein